MPSKSPGCVANNFALSVDGKRRKRIRLLSRFGEGIGSDPDANPNDYVYLLHGSVPEATSHADAENKVKKLLHEIEQGFKSRRPKGEKGMPAPVTRVWRWRQ